MGQYASVLEKIEEKIDEQYERYVEYFQNYHPNRLEAVRERSGLEPVREISDLESQIQRSGLEPVRERSGLDLSNNNRRLKKRTLSNSEMLDEIKMARSVDDFPDPHEYDDANLNFGGKKSRKKSIKRKKINKKRYSKKK
tara:strand:- start:3206 stop:3625 length:420 start_codon:yes stop_codon:yes gene_type:complete